MKVNGRMIRPMVSEHINILMELCTKVNGKKTNNMDLVKRLGQMELVMKVIMWKGRKMGKVSLCGLMVQLMKDSSRIIISMVMVNMFGLMKESMSANG